MLKAEVKEVPLKDLYLDPNNYRLINDKRYSYVRENNVTDDLVQKRTLGILRGAKNENIEDLLNSFRENGYLPVDQIQVRRLQNSKYLVLEGNRRAAALKTLQEQHETDAISTDNFDLNLLNSVPVVIYSGSGNEIQHLIVMGLKHISGNKKWGEWNQAQLIKRLSEDGTMTEEQICNSIGIDKTSLRRNLRTLSLIDQYKQSDYGDQFSETMYPVFREIVSLPAVRNWAGWNDGTYKAENAEKLERLFALLSKDSVYDGQDSDQARIIEPAITKREEVRTLAKFIDDEKALQNLEESRNISTAYNISKSGVKERLIQPQENLLEEFSNNVDAVMQLQLQQKNYSPLQKQIYRLQGFLDKEMKASGTSFEDVFYSHISSHFTEVQIASYKLFENSTVSGLKRINIFAGENNAGKTSILEAVYLLCKQNSFSGIQEIIRRRGKTAEAKIDAEWFLGQIPEKIFIDGIFDNMKAAVSLKHLKEDSSDFDSTGYLETIQIGSTYNNQKQNSLIRLFSNRERDTRTEGTKIVCPVIFSSPFFLNEPYRYSEFYYQSVKSKTIPRILEFIEKSFLPGVKDIRMADELQRFLVSDESFTQAMDISSYGEGLQRIFFISLLFASAENGILLIDEFENAIHMRLLSDFAAFIEELAKEFNVQVFLTSHSKECIDAFITNVKNSEEVSCYSLVKNKSEVNIRHFPGEVFYRLLKSGDTDLRTIK
jgi:AAA15 family ATPase/GTPase